MKTPTAKVLPFAALGIFLLTMTSCGALDIESRWRDSEIAVDGRLDDWQGRLFDIEDINVSFGVQNDSQFLYLSLRVADPRVLAQMMRSGLVVWLDPSGGKSRAWGIHYPIGRSWDDFRGLQGRAQEAPEKRRQALRQELEEVEIIGPGRDEKARFKTTEVPGIEIASSRAAGMFVYEVKIPFAKAEGVPFAVGTVPGRPVGIGIDSPKPDVVMPGRGMGGPGLGGMGPGGYGRGGGGRGGIMVGRGLRGAAPLKLWLKAQLAEPPR